MPTAAATIEPMLPDVAIVGKQPLSDGLNVCDVPLGNAIPVEGVGV